MAQCCGHEAIDIPAARHAGAGRRWRADRAVSSRRPHDFTSSTRPASLRTTTPTSTAMRQGWLRGEIVKPRQRDWLRGPYRQRQPKRRRRPLALFASGLKSSGGRASRSIPSGPLGGLCPLIPGVHA
jgi:hypothetical protein